VPTDQLAVWPISTLAAVLKTDGNGKIIDALWDAADGPLYMIYLDA